MTFILIYFIAQLFSGSIRIAPVDKRGPAYPLRVDTTDQTAWILKQVEPCGTDDSACVSGFAAVCALSIDKIPGNCTIFCNDVVSCNAPTVQDADGVWSSK